jgi:hypothetical protein
LKNFQEILSNARAAHTCSYTPNKPSRLYFSSL